jgi:hypothetical protein
VRWFQKSLPVQPRGLLWRATRAKWLEQVTLFGYDLGL